MAGSSGGSEGKDIQIAVIGAGKASEAELKAAYELGKAIALAGCILFCGGLGGVMDAAARGARSAGGLTVGILPGTSKEDANPFIDIAVVTGMGHARNAIIARTADALIAVGGGAGTLSEVALGLKMGKPVIFIKHAMPRFSLANMEIDLTESPAKAVEMAMEKRRNQDSKG